MTSIHTPKTVVWARKFSIRARLLWLPLREWFMSRVDCITHDPAGHFHDVQSKTVYEPARIHLDRLSIITAQNCLIDYWKSASVFFLSFQFNCAGVERKHWRNVHEIYDHNREEWVDGEEEGKKVPTFHLPMCAGELEIPTGEIKVRCVNSA